MGVTVIKRELNRELLEAYKNFGCHIISSTFEILMLWAQPYTTYPKGQVAAIQNELPLLVDMEIYEIYGFFYRSEGNDNSGLEALIKGLELTLEAEPFVAKARPMLLKSFQEINRFRRHRHLETFDFPSLP